MCIFLGVNYVADNSRPPRNMPGFLSLFSSGAPVLLDWFHQRGQVKSLGPRKTGFSTWDARPRTLDRDSWIAVLPDKNGGFWEPLP